METRKDTSSTSVKLRFSERLGYGLGTAGEMFPFFMVMSYLFFFFNVVLGIDALVIGNIMLIARIWDAINDPIMGSIADHTRTKWGSYRPYVFFASVPMALFATLTFTDFGLAGAAKIAVASACYIGFGMSNTASLIPLGSMLNAMTTDYEERSVLGTFRELGSTIGQTVASVAIPVILGLMMKTGLSDAGSYTATALVMGLLSIVMLGITFFTTKERVKPAKTKSTLIESFQVLKGNRYALCLIIGFFLINMYSTLRMSFNIYYGGYYLGRDAAILLTIQSIAPFFILYFIPALTRRFSKKVAMMSGGACYALAGVLFLIARTNLPLNYAAAFISGWGSVLANSSMWAMLPDAADYGELKSGVRAPAFVYSIANFGAKLAMSVGAYVIALALSIIKFDQNAAVQASSTISGIYWFNGLSLVAMGFLLILVMVPYDLSAKEAAEISEKLTQQRGENTL